MGWREKNEALIARAMAEAQEKMMEARAARAAEKEEPKAGRPVWQWTDDEVRAEAERDRAEDLGRYGITPAMREEIRRMDRPVYPGGPVQHGSVQLWDE